MGRSSYSPIHSASCRCDREHHSAGLSTSYLDRNSVTPVNIEIIRTPRVLAPLPSASDIRVMKLWSELDPNDGFGSFRGQPEGQTQGQQELYTPYLVKNGVWAGSWGANQNSPIISNADLLRISTQQKPDAVYTLNQKMQHITNAGRGTWGQAIKATYTPSDNWRAAVDIRINQAVYANNRVEILERKVMTVDTFGTVTILRIRTGWDQIHKYTAVTSANAHYENVKGGIYLPLLPKAGYEWWILERWTKPL